MSIGAIAISTNAKKEIPVPPAPPGPPFELDSANNGLSVDPVSEKIVLGNTVGDITAPARLLDNREIFCQPDVGIQNFGVILNNNRTLVTMLLRGDRLVITGSGTTGGQVTINAPDTTAATIQALSGLAGSSSVRANAGDGGIGELTVASGVTDLLTIRADGLGSIGFFIQGLFASMQINTTTVCTKFQSNIGAAFNGATVQVSGTCTKRMFQESHGAGTYNLDRDLDSAKVFMNSGALLLQWPNMVGANFREGFYVDLNCTDASGISILAAAGMTIRYGSLASSVGGAIGSTDVGAFIRVMIIDAFTGVVCFSTGVWNLA